MKISHVSIQGLRGLSDRHQSFTSSATGSPHDLIVVSGPPASGKTRFLEALIAAFEVTGGYIGIVRGSDWVTDKAKNGRIELGLSLDEEERSRAPGCGEPARAVALFSSERVAAEVDKGLSRLLEHYSHDPTCGKREYFPETRQLAWGSRVDGLSELEQRVLRPTKEAQKYSCLPTFLSRLPEDSDKQAAFAEALELLSPTVRYAPDQPEGNERTFFSSRGSKPAYLSELSSSEANAVIFAATACAIGLNHSIVFVDRPELYVAADRAAHFVQALGRIGRDNQWIVATSEPRIVAAVDPSQLVLVQPTAGSAR